MQINLKDFNSGIDCNYSVILVCMQKFKVLVLRSTRASYEAGMEARHSDSICIEGYPYVVLYSSWWYFIFKYGSNRTDLVGSSIREQRLACGNII